MNYCEQYNSLVWQWIYVYPRLMRTFDNHAQVNQCQICSGNIPWNKRRLILFEFGLFMFFFGCSILSWCCWSLKFHEKHGNQRICRIVHNIHKPAKKHLNREESSNKNPHFPFGKVVGKLWCQRIWVYYIHTAGKLQLFDPSSNFATNRRGRMKSQHFSLNKKNWNTGTAHTSRNLNYAKKDETHAHTHPKL